METETVEPMRMIYVANLTGEGAHMKGGLYSKLGRIAKCPEMNCTIRKSKTVQIINLLINGQCSVW